MLGIKTILHPTDFSASSDLAFRFACSLARDHGACLVVVHVLEAPVAFYGEGGAVPPPQIDRVAAKAMLREIAPEDPKIITEHRFVEGDAVTEILRAAEDNRCDLIVMGTHGRKGISRLLMGSVAEKVVRKAACPVLTVKSPAPEKAASETTKRTAEVATR